MERAKFRRLRLASLLALGVATLTPAIAGDRHRVWVDPPSDLVADAAQGDWSDPSARPASARDVSVNSQPDANAAGAIGQPTQTGSISEPEADAGMPVKASEEASNAVPDGRAPVAGEAPAETETRTASREDSPVAEPAPVRRTGVAQERPRATPRHAGRRTHRVRLAAPRSSILERIFGPPRRGSHVVSIGSIR